MKIDHFVSDWQSNDRSSASDQSSFLCQVWFISSTFYIQFNRHTSAFLCCFSIFPEFSFLFLSNQREFLFISQIFLPSSWHHELKIKTERSKSFLLAKCMRRPKLIGNFLLSTHADGAFCQMFFASSEVSTRKNFLWRALKQLRPQPIVTFPCPTIRNINIICLWWCACSQNFLFI